jgi:serine/threonine protein kinase
MNANEPPPEADDPRVIAALEEYLAAVESGARPNRQAFLARHAAVAEALAECLDGMDALHGAASSSSHRPGAFASASAPLQPEAPLGDFRVVREVGHGGMGTVYEAVQLSLGRRVALKVLPFAAALDAKHLQRFKNEAHAAAQLHHTNIVPVYAVGHDRGVHFYAMQLIEGQNLAAVIDGLRRQKGEDGPPAPADRPRELPGDCPTGPYPPVPEAPPAADTKPALGPQLSTLRSARPGENYRTAARLIAQAAEGLEYAHQTGVIHRDVKPANLLVDARGNVWLTDFGLASVHAEAGLTQTGDLLGTLRYMSPEQAGGQRVLIDHRTDVYSLGATLYELLTLRPMFDGADRQTLLHQILNEEPRPPRALGPAIPAELETIVLKAVSKAPAERYATAGEFAEDLHRFLRHEPIKARRATPGQRARKWLRRHPSVLVGGAVLLALLAAGSLAATWVIRGEQKKTERAYELVRGEQEKAERAYRQEREQKKQAEDRFQLAQRAVEDMIELAEQEMADMPFLGGLRIRMLESALAYYQELIEHRGDDPDAQARFFATRTRVQRILSDLTALQGAGDLFLLRKDVVLKELRLSADQKARVAELLSRLDRERDKVFEDFRRLTEAQRRQKFLEQAHAGEDGLRAVLTPGQQRRFKQIALQAQGPWAFQGPKVSAELKLTAEQKEKIRGIVAGLFLDFPWGRGGPGRFGPGGRRGGPDRGAPPDRRGRGGASRGGWGHEEALKAVQEKILNVLTEEQTKRWQEMTGAPVEGLAPDCPPGPPPGQPPPPPFGPRAEHD